MKGQEGRLCPPALEKIDTITAERIAYVDKGTASAPHPLRDGLPVTLSPFGIVCVEG